MATATPTRTRTPSATPTQSPESSFGPTILFFGVLRPDDSLLDPIGEVDGIPLYRRAFGSGFTLVVEARPGLSNRPVGRSSFSDFERPDLQIQANRALGDGSPLVCDVLEPNPGGVPAIDPPSFEASDPLITDILNDWGCRFQDGQGNPKSRNCSEGCIRFETGELGCKTQNATAQFCGLVARTLEFPPGDTLVTVRVRDTANNLGPPAQIIIRIEP